MLLPKGSVHEHRVSMFCDLMSDVTNLKCRIKSAILAKSYTKSSVLLKSYANLICFSHYCAHVFDNPNEYKSFQSLFQSMPEVSRHIESISQTLSNLFEYNIYHSFNVNRNTNSVNFSSSCNLYSSVNFSSSCNLYSSVNFSSSCNLRSSIHSSYNDTMISSGNVLRAYPINTEDISSDIPGVQNLRQLLPDVPFFTCGLKDNIVQSAEELVKHVQSLFSLDSIHWVDVKGELCVYINNIPYALTNSSVDPFELASVHIPAGRIVQLEAELKRDVLSIASQFQGRVNVHRPNVENRYTATSIQVESIASSNETLLPCTFPLSVEYVRLPIPATDKLRLDDFAPIIEVFKSFNDTQGIIIVDSSGGMRSTIALNILSIVRCSLKTSLSSILSPRDIMQCLSLNRNMRLLRTFSATHCEPHRIENDIELHLANQLAQMLVAGNAQGVLKHFLDLAGKGLRSNILVAVQLYNTNDSRDKYRAMASARAYLYLVVLMVYLDLPSPAISFGEWLAKHSQIGIFIDKYAHNERKLLEYVVHDALPSEHTVANRKGRVLMPNFGLKADHFPGCHRKTVTPIVPGAPNMRKVRYLNLYGVAIPTLRGVRNVLHLLTATRCPLQYPGDPIEENLAELHPQGSFYNRTGGTTPALGHVLWINLREEPILYVGDRPFVFRDLTNPYANVEFTGIHSKTLVQLENELRNDVLNEASEHNGQFMVHDEVEAGQLVGVLEPVTPASVQTVSHVFESERISGTSVEFVRLPVTDEMTLEVKTYDKIAKILLHKLVAFQFNTNTAFSIVFNCQMGRGRTTTGMVITGLIFSLVYPQYMRDLRNQATTPAESPDQYNQGLYKCILQLIALLKNGLTIKSCVDLVIDECSCMQNLRTAIYDLKKQLNDTNERQRHHAHRYGISYLQRYFYLICFNAYLHDNYSPTTSTLAVTFQEWLNGRSEIQSLYSSISLQ